MRESTPWPDIPIRRASVNSFGYGGANAHTILDAIDVLAPGRGGARSLGSMAAAKYRIDSFKNGYLDGSPNGHLNGSIGNHSEEFQRSQRRFFLLPLSAHNERTLRKYIETLHLCVDQWSMLDLSYTLGYRRSIFSTRSFVVTTAEQAKESLKSQDITIYKPIGSSKISLGFVFTGRPPTPNAGSLS